MLLMQRFGDLPEKQPHDPEDTSEYYYWLGVFVHKYARAELNGTLTHAHFCGINPAESAALFRTLSVSNIKAHIADLHKIRGEIQPEPLKGAFEQFDKICDLRNRLVHVGAFIFGEKSFVSNIQRTKSPWDPTDKDCGNTTLRQAIHDLGIIDATIYSYGSNNTNLDGYYHQARSRAQERAWLYKP